MSNIPSEDQIRKWIKSNRDRILSGMTEDKISKQMETIIGSDALNQIIAAETGLRYDTWGKKFELSYSYEHKNNSLYKLIQPHIQSILEKIIDEEFINNFAFSQREIATIKIAYKKACFETAKEEAEERGRKFGHKIINKIINEEIEKE